MKRPENWSGGRCFGSIVMPAFGDTPYLSCSAVIREQTNYESVVVSCGFGVLEAAAINLCRTTVLLEQGDALFCQPEAPSLGWTTASEWFTSQLSQDNCSNCSRAKAKKEC